MPKDRINSTSHSTSERLCDYVIPWWRQQVPIPGTPKPLPVHMIIFAEEPPCQSRVPKSSPASPRPYRFEVRNRSP
jgi:hypothetical protein